MIQGKELFQGPDGPMCVVKGSDGKYDLYALRLDHVGTFKRKYAAASAAATGDMSAKVSS